MFYGCVGRLWGGKVKGKTFRSGEKLVVEFSFYRKKKRHTHIDNRNIASTWKSTAVSYFKSTGIRIFFCA